MAVVIRLQGLNATAGTDDIRKFFTGLKIPHGGVHIIGGELEEAFIIFASDEDARRAMRRSLGCIKGSPVTLLLSSKTEMQDMLEKSTSTAQEQKRRPEENARRDGKSMDLEVGRRPFIARDHSPNPHRQGPSSSNEELYLFLRGLPYTATEQDILNFFSGLAVDDIILLNNAPGTGVVKFATSQDAYEGLKRDREYIGSRYVEVSRHRGPYLGGGSGNLQMNRNRDNISVRDRSPVRHQRNPQHHARSKSPAVGPEEEYCVLVENLAYTVEKVDIKILFSKANLKDDQILHLLSSDGRRTRCVFVLFRSQRDYCDALTNEKRLFQNRWVMTRPISREKMIALLESKDKSDRPYGDSERVQERPPSFPRDGYDSERAMGISDRPYPRDGYGSERTMGISDRPYTGDGFDSERAMGFNDRPYAGDGYDSKRAMGFSDRPYHNPERIQERPLSHPDGGYDSEKCCLLVQNLPSDVRKDEIMNFFFGFNVTEDMVHIIGGHSGDGVGKALILFRSEAEATNVLPLDGQRFLGSEVILKCITRSQMQQLRYNQSMSQTQMVQNPVPRGEQYFGSSVASYRPDDTKYPDYRIPSEGLPQMGHSSGQIHGVPSHEPYGGGLLNSQDKGNGFRGNYDAPVQSHGGPVCVQLLNLPFRIERAEIYDFCYGYHIIPGSVQLQFDPSGRPDGTATAAFESHQEALKAIRELSGRPIGPRKIELVLM